MAREKEAYRPILESIMAFMAERGGGHIMRQIDVAAFTGLSQRTVAKRYGVTKNGISAERLAMILAGL